MRERLAAAFVVLAVAVLLLAGLARAQAVGDLLRDQALMNLRTDAGLIAAVVDEQRSSGDAVDRRMLDGLVRTDSRLEYRDPGGRPVVVTGREFDDEELLTSETQTADGGTVVLSTGAQQASDLYARELASLVMLVLLVAILAGLGGWLAARWLASPFRALADAAAQLGRGRFDVRLPETRIPEAQAIGQALRVSAAQLESRLSRERDFAEYASHQLRTPLTSLRLELEDLALRTDLPADVREAAERCLARVEAADAAAGEVVSMSREGVLVEGGQLMLGELATQITQTWSDRLAGSRRTVTARAEGEIDQLFTPGPIEQILEAVLAEVTHGEGPVQLYFEGSPTHVRVVVPAGVAGDGPGAAVELARDLALRQGGRTSGDLVTGDLDIWLPRR